MRTILGCTPNVPFDNDFVREAEEFFARLLTGCEDVTVSFSRSGSCTDGRHIFLDPGVDDPFKYRSGIVKAEEAIGAEPGTYLKDRNRTLYTLTRALNIHECLHIMYTEFPVIRHGEVRAKTQNGKKVLANIINIIEDYYIEMTGCSIYNNMSVYLKFMRTAIGFSSNRDCSDKRLPRVVSFLNHMIARILYPMVPLDPPPKWMVRYINSTREAFDRGCTSNDPSVRYQCACEIYDLIVDLIPERSISKNSWKSIMQHSDPESCTQELGPIYHPISRPAGMIPAPMTEGTTDATRTWDRFSVFYDGLGHEGLDRDYSAVDIMIREYEKMRENKVTIIPSSNFPGPHCHEGVGIKETVLGIEPRLRDEYDMVRERVSVLTNSLDQRLRGLLSTWDRIEERKLIIGNMLDSRCLYDTQGRMWKRNYDEEKPPNIAVMLLMDGSGSMTSIRDRTVESCTCIHEVLSNNGVTHSIAVHRSIYNGNMEVDILKDFTGNQLQRTNLLRYQCRGFNRDGLALLWAEDRLTRCCPDADSHLIIIASDGMPNHCFNDVEYNGASARKDVRMIVDRMERDGTEVVGLALSENSSLSDGMRKMYSHVLECNGPYQLPQKLFEILSEVYGRFRHFT